MFVARRYVQLNQNFLVFRHLHDEAAMRLRSWDGCQVTGVHRSTTSNTVHVDGYSGLPWLTPLQPLAKKDSDTELMGTIDGSGLRLVPRPTPKRFVHVLVQDSVSANMAAARKLFKFISSGQNDGPWGQFCYRLIVVRCASHQANLAVRAAITKPAVETNVPDLEATCVRMYKYLLPIYHEEFLANLRNWVTGPCFDGRWSLDDNIDRLQGLYGPEVLPHNLLKVLRESPVEKSAALFELERNLLRSQERPTVTRFWLFTECVFGLVRWFLLDVPPEDVIKVNVANPREEGQKRLEAVNAFFTHDETVRTLRRAVLCRG